MRAILVLSLALSLSSCASAPSRASWDDKFAELESAVSELPESPGKGRVRDLVGEMRRLVAADGTAARESDRLAEIDALNRLAESSRVVELEIGFASGLKDWDADGELDGIEVYFTPRDAEGDAVKRPGYADIYLLEKGFLGSTKELETWTASQGLLASSWNEGLFPAYVLRLQWRGAPPEILYGTVRVDFHPLAGEALSASRHLESGPE